MHKLIELLIDLGADHQNIDKLKKDTQGFLSRYKLSTEEKEAIREALKTHSAEPIRKLIPAGDLSKHNNVQVNIL
jgi:hypothetical protein